MSLGHVPAAPGPSPSIATTAVWTPIRRPSVRALLGASVFTWLLIGCDAARDRRWVCDSACVSEGLPEGTVTFLFSDVEGSTRLLQEIGETAYAEALAEHRRVIQEVCDRQRGRLVDREGDASFLAFGSASEALQAASLIQEALKEGPVRVRVGSTRGRRCLPTAAMSVWTCIVQPGLLLPRMAARLCFRRRPERSSGTIGSVTHPRPW